jgi:16S rRNA (uracil1498-N3)-methyltransferase
MDTFIGNKVGETRLLLGADEIRHCVKVLRKKSGEKIRVINGKGDVWIGALLEDSAKTAEVLLVNEVLNNTKHKGYKFHLIVAPTKNSDRMEWLLEKAVETGLDSFYLVITNRTERKKVNVERLEKVALAALKQSGQLIIPTIKVFSFNAFCNLSKSLSEQKFICSCEDLEGIKPLYTISESNDISVLVGPEGDFTTAEYAMAIQHGFVPISLGSQRFRTETAALLTVMAKHSFSSQSPQ